VVVVSRLLGRAVRTKAPIHSMTLGRFLFSHGWYRTVPDISHICPTVGMPAGISAQVLVHALVAPGDPNSFSRINEVVVRKPTCKHSFAPWREHLVPTMTDTILTIRCPHCMAGIEFRILTAYKDGRFVCRDCAHTVRPGIPENKCTCRACLRLSRESLSTAHGSHLLTQ
jgi:hypothetical protein